MQILLKLVSNNLINRARKIFRRETNTFWSAHFVFIGVQEILPLIKYLYSTQKRRFIESFSSVTRGGEMGHLHPQA